MCGRSLGEESVWHGDGGRVGARGISHATAVPVEGEMWDGIGGKDAAGVVFGAPRRNGQGHSGGRV